MGRGTAQKMLARTLAVIGLAAAISTGLTGFAGAAPADRSGDAVVLKGSDLGGLLGTAPDKIVGFKWSGGQWAQIPVQVDERHTINARQLYPDDANGYVGPTTKGFQLEVYADAKTRSGVDEDASFDADDEFTFMAGDSGPKAPASAGVPEGANGGSGVKVDVSDTLGGGHAYVYLFKSTGGLDPSAGMDYVDYDFKLTNLPAGGSLLNDYGYIHSTNPEDSTVKTKDYELHSTDRWMEDELKVKTGDSTGVDILDREVAQATLFYCGRTEYTFSGHWLDDNYPANDGDTDDEGTYVATIDGPVRAIRSYMGSNSGPYTQREHIYYADHEVNTIFLRVHPMLDLYSWTDYAPSAIGMTYRDSKNLDGVTVDGDPDTLTPTTSADVAGGAYAWQQLSGPQGTVSSVVGAVTNIPDANFGNYYLDTDTPSGAMETQCGGDGKSIGASGFGILGPTTPNTDPRTDPFNDLTVKRVRYFGPPSDGATQAETYKERVAKPLAASSSASPFSNGPAVKLKVSLPGKKAKAHRGKAYKVRVRVANSGKLAAKKVKVCVRGAALKRRGACRVVAVVPSRKARVAVVKVRVKANAKGRKLRLTVTAQAQKVKAAKRLNVRLK
ncbi:MAG: hypothetical protein J0H98_01520 [Solirubrobacterales bacterium]|nr:hypothetical protein [Solirubrobacterales bacterium]